MGVGGVVGLCLAAVALLVVALAGAFCIGTRYSSLGPRTGREDGSLTATSGVRISCILTFETRM